jgi:ubiquitin C-terminal hydrolase
VDVQQSIVPKNQNQNQYLPDDPFKKPVTFEPLKVNERARDPGLPSGLKNIGQTCYFNSLIQPLFFMPNIQEKIINFDLDSKFTHLQPIDDSKMD